MKRMKKTLKVINAIEIFILILILIKLFLGVEFSIIAKLLYFFIGISLMRIFMEEIGREVRE